MTDSLLARLESRRRAAQRRLLLNDLSRAVPPLLAIAFIAQWLEGPLAIVIVVPLLLMLAFVERRRLARFDTRWLARQLDAQWPQLEDSSALLLVDTQTTGPLIALQRERLRARLAERTLPDLRPPWPARRVAVAAALSLLVAGLFAWQPWRGHVLHGGAAAPAVGADGLAAGLRITPPTYTGVAAFRATSAEASFPAGSMVRWQLRFAHAPSAVTLRLRDGQAVPLQRDGDAWQGEQVIAASTLYRIDAPGSGVDAQRLYRLEARPDLPPQITVRAPDKTLNLLEKDQKQWQLAFAAHDDYGLGEAQLSISHAQGTGELIKVTEQTVTLKGDGDAHDREYRDTLDLTKLGFEQGDDLIVRLSVADNRQPTPNLSRSASFILRWPAEDDDESVGMEGLVGKAMPAYFRSERQIIIDTEALLAQQEQLSTAAYAKRANAIGDDQKLLRLRYGRFLGEETEGGPHDEDHDDHEGPPPPDAARAVEQEYGHVHDIAEAATLFDEPTKQLLRRALNEMWSAEGLLRTAQLPEALPHEHRALEAIKQVQQSTRIYLARAGLDLPPIDPKRRLTGDRSGLVNPPASPIGSGDGEAQAVVDAWRALQTGQPVDAAALDTWLRAHPQHGDVALDVLRAADELRRTPDCAACRQRLAARLWPLLPTPPTALQPRAAPDAQTQAYRQALQGATP
ncbi:DUF4175 domain-containing protein [Solimonas marina]|uniref:DUF4175 domain-containing protein n=1 Tax=Solimonas marina TaxID=2714601 RepID=A0A970B806_9GAMM|nr:DUF4175 domain-containing protein [Solimonas marina]NKF24473.1 DUF4175 domain-containing protein [Solimonas marina]